LSGLWSAVLAMGALASMSDVGVPVAEALRAEHTLPATRNVYYFIMISCWPPEGCAAVTVRDV
jgi:hypothetical protein